jgi:multidrug resistance efflux pump
MTRLASTMALLGLAVLASSLAAQDRRTDAPPPAKPRMLTRLEALEQFRKLTPQERLQRVQKVTKDDKAFVAVKRGDLELVVVERGQVEAADAVDIVCRVKARTPGSTIATTVRSVIDDGTFVKKGDTLVTLDDSAVKDQLRAQTILVEKAAAEKAAAEESLALARKQNELDVRTATIAFKEVSLALKREGGNDADLKDLLTLKVEQAKLSLEVARLQGKVRENTATAAVKAKSAVLAQEDSRKQDLLAEVRACVLKAPSDGLAVYYIPEQARWGVGRQSIVAQGEQVSEGQKLMQICGLKRFVVNTKVHEALIARVRAGQPVIVRVDAFYDRPLRGHVKTVAHVASAPDFLSADVKVFAVRVALDQTIDGLRPGGNAEVHITIDKRQKVLVVPAQSALRVGRGLAFCFVKTDKGVVERAVKIGARDDHVVEVKEGLAEGELVLRSPRAVALLSAPPPARDKPGARGPAWPRATSIVVRSVRPNGSGTAPRTRIEAYGLTYKDLERIKTLPNLAEIVPVRRFTLQVRHLERLQPNAEVRATVPEYKDCLGLRLAAGRFLTQEDERQLKNVVVLGADIGEHLFPEEDAVGKTVRIDKFFYLVVGVIQEQPGQIDNGVFLPLATCKARFGERVFTREAGSWKAEAVALHEILLTAQKPEQVPLLVESIKTLLEEAHPRKDWAVGTFSPKR